MENLFSQYELDTFSVIDASVPQIIITGRRSVSTKRGIRSKLMGLNQMEDRSGIESS